MVLVKPASYRAARDFTFQGVNYPKGAPISTVLIKRMPHLSSLLSRRWIEPVPDPNRRRGPWRHQATHVGAAMLGVTALVQEAEVESQSSEAPPPNASEDFPGYPVNGTVADVKAWVGDDPDRAEYAMEQENLRGTPRVTLLDYLTTVGA